MDSHILESAKALFFQLIGGNQDPWRAWLIIIIGLLAGACVLAWVGSMMNGNGVSFLSALPVTILDTVLLLIVAAAVREYLCPRMAFMNPGWVVPGATVLAFLLIIIPLTARILSLNYLVSLVTLTCAVVALILSVYLTTLSFDTFRRGAGDVRARRSMKQAEDRAMSL